MYFEFEPGLGFGFTLGGSREGKGGGFDILLYCTTCNQLASSSGLLDYQKLWLARYSLHGKTLSWLIACMFGCSRMFENKNWFIGRIRYRVAYTVHSAIRPGRRAGARLAWSAGVDPLWPDPWNELINVGVWWRHLPTWHILIPCTGPCVQARGLTDKRAILQSNGEIPMLHCRLERNDSKTEG